MLQHVRRPHPLLPWPWGRSQKSDLVGPSYGDSALWSQDPGGRVPSGRSAGATGGAPGGWSAACSRPLGPFLSGTMSLPPLEGSSCVQRLTRLFGGFEGPQEI